MVSLLLLLALCLSSCLLTASQPTGLMADFQSGVALGVSETPYMSWIVPPCGNSSRGLQVFYHIVVAEETPNPSSPGLIYSTVWDSGQVASNASTNIAYAGPKLSPGTVFIWNVTTWTSSLARKTDSSGLCKSPPSKPARFVTALFNGFSANARWIWPNNASSSRFGFLRRRVDVKVGSPVVRALLFASASVDPSILSALKIYFGGSLVAIGPGRGEARVKGGNASFSNSPYMTLDVTEAVQVALQPTTPSSFVLAMEGQSPMGDSTWDAWDPSKRIVKSLPPAVLLQLHITHADGTTCSVVTEASSGQWHGKSADGYYHPLKNSHVWYNQVVENIDARDEPVGWRTVVDPMWKDDNNWKPVIDVKLGFEKLQPKMARPLQTFELPPRPLTPPPTPTSSPTETPTNQTCGEIWAVRGNPRLRLELLCPADGEMITSVFATFGAPIGSCSTGLAANLTCQTSTAVALVEGLCLGKNKCSIPVSHDEFGDPPCPDPHRLAASVKCKNSSGLGPFVVDFEQEFQGGVVLKTAVGVAGHRIKIEAGELLGQSTPGTELTGPVSQTWGYEFVWTLRAGEQIITQHNFMNFRYLSLVFLDGAPPRDLSVSAWGVSYEWNDGDSAFHSSNETLNHVWRLCENTLRFGVTDTYTDSNTRERRPYEADGLITAAARSLVQRDTMWQRHSASWVIEYPTWPIEWQQQTAFLAYHDYMVTGNADLAKAYAEKLMNNTKYKFVDNTSLIGPVQAGESFGDHGHIIGWDPDVNTSPDNQFYFSDHLAVTNAWAVRGLELLAEMALVSGNPSRADKAAKIASHIRASMMVNMWNQTEGKFCDGICIDPKVNNTGSFYTNVLTLLLGLVPEEERKGVWSAIATHGLKDIGAYGSHLFLQALAIFPEGDDGSAMLAALTKCDNTSWCAEWELYNATMTMEAFPVDVVGLTSFSHPWGTSAINGIVQGLLGIQPTAPGYASFTVRPRLGGLQHASLRLPTLFGFINVTATPESIALSLPCNTLAKACMMPSGGSSSLALPTLALDGELIPTVREGRYVCSQVPIECGSHGNRRFLTLQETQYQYP